MKEQRTRKLHRGRPACRRGRDHPASHGACVKGIALFTLIIFTAASFVWFTPPARSANPLTAQPGNPTVPTAAQIEIPEEFAVIEEIYEAPNPSGSSPLIVYVQDAHRMYEAQSNIRKIIDLLQKKHALALVGIEGGAGKMNPALLRAFPVQEVKERVIDDYVRRGEMTGAEYAAIVNEKESAFWGLEEMALYDENKSAFLKAIGEKERIDSRLGPVEGGLEKKADEVFSPGLKELYQKTGDYEKERIGLLEYVTYLSGLREKYLQPSAGPKLSALPRDTHPMMDALLVAAEREKTLPWRSVNEEAALMVREIERMLKGRDEEALNSFRDRVSASRQGEMKREDYYNWLWGEARACGLIARERSEEKYASFLKYIRHTRELEKIKGDELFREIEALEDAVKGRLFQNDAQRKLDRLLKNLKILKNLAKLELSRQELAYYREHAGEFPEKIFWDFIGEPVPAGELWDERLAPHRKFYEAALRRDAVLHENFMKLLRGEGRKFGVMITGGFHADGIKEMLKREQISYLLLIPRITQFDVKSPYWDIMQGKVSYGRYLKRGTLEAPVLTLAEPDVALAVVSTAFEQALRRIESKLTPEQRMALGPWRERVSVEEILAVLNQAANSQESEILEKIKVFEQAIIDLSEKGQLKPESIRTAFKEAFPEVRAAPVILPGQPAGARALGAKAIEDFGRFITGLEQKDPSVFVHRLRLDREIRSLRDVLLTEAENQGIPQEERDAFFDLELAFEVEWGNRQAERRKKNLVPLSKKEVLDIATQILNREKIKLALAPRRLTGQEAALEGLIREFSDYLLVNITGTQTMGAFVGKGLDLSRGKVLPAAKGGRIVAEEQIDPVAMAGEIDSALGGVMRQLAENVKSFWDALKADETILENEEKFRNRWRPIREMLTTLNRFLIENGFYMGVHPTLVTSKTGKQTLEIKRYFSRVTKRSQYQVGDKTIDALHLGELLVGDVPREHGLKDDLSLIFETPITESVPEILRVLQDPAKNYRTWISDLDPLATEIVREAFRGKETERDILEELKRSVEVHEVRHDADSTLGWFLGSSEWERKIQTETSAFLSQISYAGVPKYDTLNLFLVASSYDSQRTDGFVDDPYPHAGLRIFSKLFPDIFPDYDQLAEKTPAEVAEILKARGAEILNHIKEMNTETLQSKAKGTFRELFSDEPSFEAVPVPIAPVTARALGVETLTIALSRLDAADLEAYDRGDRTDWEHLLEQVMDPWTDEGRDYLTRLQDSAQAKPIIEKALALQWGRRDQLRKDLNRVIDQKLRTDVARQLANLGKSAEEISDIINTIIAYAVDADDLSIQFLFLDTRALVTERSSHLANMIREYIREPNVKINAASQYAGEVRQRIESSRPDIAARAQSILDNARRQDLPTRFILEKGDPRNAEVLRMLAAEYLTRGNSDEDAVRAVISRVRQNFNRIHPLALSVFDTRKDIDFDAFLAVVGSKNELIGKLLTKEGTSTKERVAAFLQLAEAYKPGAPGEMDVKARELFFKPEAKRPGEPQAPPQAPAKLKLPPYIEEVVPHVKFSRAEILRLVGEMDAAIQKAVPLRQQQFGLFERIGKLLRGDDLEDKKDVKSRAARLEAYLEELTAIRSQGNKYDFNALSDLLGKIGKPVGKVTPTPERQLTPSFQEAAKFAGLDTTTVIEALDAINTAVNKAIPPEWKTNPPAGRNVFLGEVTALLVREKDVALRAERLKTFIGMREEIERRGSEEGFFRSLLDQLNRISVAPPTEVPAKADQVIELVLQDETLGIKSKEELNQILKSIGDHLLTKIRRTDLVEAINTVLSERFGVEARAEFLKGLIKERGNILTTQFPIQAQKIIDSLIGEFLKKQQGVPGAPVTARALGAELPESEDEFVNLLKDRVTSKDLDEYLSTGGWEAFKLLLSKGLAPEDIARISPELDRQTRTRIVRRLLEHTAPSRPPTPIREYHARTEGLRKLVEEIKKTENFKGSIESLGALLEYVGEYAFLYEVEKGYTDNGQVSQSLFERVQNLLFALARSTEPGPAADLAMITLPVGFANTIGGPALGNAFKNEFMKAIEKEVKAGQPAQYRALDLGGSSQAYVGTRLVVLGLNPEQLETVLKKTYPEIIDRLKADPSLKLNPEQIVKLDQLKNRIFAGHTQLTVPDLHKSLMGISPSLAAEAFEGLIMDKLKKLTAYAQAQEDLFRETGIFTEDKLAKPPPRGMSREAFTGYLKQAERKFIPQFDYFTGRLARPSHDIGRVRKKVEETRENFEAAVKAVESGSPDALEKAETFKKSFRELLALLDVALVRSLQDIRYKHSYKLEAGGLQKIVQAEIDESLNHIITRMHDEVRNKDLLSPDERIQIENTAGGLAAGKGFYMTKMGDEIGLIYRVDGRWAMTFLELDKFNALNEVYLPDDRDSIYHGILESIRRLTQKEDPDGEKIYPFSKEDGLTTVRQHRQFLKELNDAIGETVVTFKEALDLKTVDGRPIRILVTRKGKPIFTTKIESGDQVKVKDMEFQYTEKIDALGGERVPLFEDAGENVYAISDEAVYDASGKEIAERSNFKVGVEHVMGPTGATVTTDTITDLENPDGEVIDLVRHFKRLGRASGEQKKLGLRGEVVEAAAILRPEGPQDRVAVARALGAFNTELMRTLNKADIGDLQSFQLIGNQEAFEALLRKVGRPPTLTEDPWQTVGKDRIQRMVQTLIRAKNLNQARSEAHEKLKGVVDSRSSAAKSPEEIREDIFNLAFGPYGAPGLGIPENALELAVGAIANEPRGIRPPTSVDTSKPGALLQLPAAPRQIVVGDLQGRFDTLLDILASPGNLADLAKGRLQLVVNGDAVHPSRDRMNEEGNIDSVAAYALISYLKATYPNAVYYLPGNHDYAHVGGKKVQKVGNLVDVRGQPRTFKSTGVAKLKAGEFSAEFVNGRWLATLLGNVKFPVQVYDQTGNPVKGSALPKGLVLKFNELVEDFYRGEITLPNGEVLVTSLIIRNNQPQLLNEQASQFEDALTRVNNDQGLNPDYLKTAFKNFVRALPIAARLDLGNGKHALVIHAGPSQELVEDIGSGIIGGLGDTLVEENIENNPYLAGEYADRIPDGVLWQRHFDPKIIAEFMKLADCDVLVVGHTMPEDVQKILLAHGIDTLIVKGADRHGDGGIGIGKIGDRHLVVVNAETDDVRIFEVDQKIMARALERGQDFGEVLGGMTTPIERPQRAVARALGAREEDRAINFVMAQAGLEALQEGVSENDLINFVVGTTPLERQNFFETLRTRTRAAFADIRDSERLREAALAISKLRELTPDDVLSKLKRAEIPGSVFQGRLAEITSALNQVLVAIQERAQAAIPAKAVGLLLKMRLAEVYDSLRQELLSQGKGVPSFEDVSRDVFGPKMEALRALKKEQRKAGRSVIDQYDAKTFEARAQNLAQLAEAIKDLGPGGEMIVYMTQDEAPGINEILTRLRIEVKNRGGTAADQAKTLASIKKEMSAQIRPEDLGRNAKRTEKAGAGAIFVSQTLANEAALREAAIGNKVQADVDAIEGVQQAVDFLVEFVDTLKEIPPGKEGDKARLELEDAVQDWGIKQEGGRFTLNLEVFVSSITAQFRSAMLARVAA